jgi:Co/Zn/Cd efflux system component
MVTRTWPDTARNVMILVAALNLGYFGVELAVALAIGAGSLFADSIDFLEDASVDFLIAVALGWRATWRARVGMILAGILLLPALAALWAAWTKLVSPVPPSPVPLTVTGVGALAINLSCALMLARVRHHSGSLTHAAFLRRTTMSLPTWRSSSRDSSRRRRTPSGLTLSSGSGSW